MKIDGDLKEIPREVAKTIAFDEEYILPVEVWGIDLRDGKVLCDDTAFLLLNQLTFEERGLYFAMLNQDPQHQGFSWNKIVDLIPGKGSKTLRPILNKLVRVGVVRTKRRSGYDVYIAKRIEVLQGAG